MICENSAIVSKAPQEEGKNNDYIVFYLCIPHTPPGSNHQIDAINIVPIVLILHIYIKKYSITQIPSLSR